MKKTLLLSIWVIAFSLQANAQNSKNLKNNPDQLINATQKCFTVENEIMLQQKNPHRLNQKDFEKWLSPKLSKFKRARKYNKNVETAVTIPVVVHVIHNGDRIGEGENISDAQVFSQLQVLNEDFRRLSGSRGFNDHPDGADIEMEFCLAQTDPSGFFTTGIDRVEINPYTNNFEPSGDWESIRDLETMKTQTIWDPDKYLNIWVARFAGQNLLGYAQFPSSSGLDGLFEDEGEANTDGVIMQFDVFGSEDHNDGSFTLDPLFNLGRTTTHEVGHFFGLRHIWGDGSEFLGDDLCQIDDFCEDTPNAAMPNFECVDTDSCTSQPGEDMIENYMDYTPDSCMNIFTNDQKDRMLTVLANSPRRGSLLTSNVCNPAPLGDPTVRFINNSLANEEYNSTGTILIGLVDDPSEKNRLFDATTGEELNMRDPDFALDVSGNGRSIPAPDESNAIARFFYIESDILDGEIEIKLPNHDNLVNLNGDPVIVESLKIQIDPIVFTNVTDGTDAQGNPNPDIIKVEALFNSQIDYSEYVERVFRPFYWWSGIPGDDQYNPMHSRVQVITEAPNIYTLVINPLPEATKVTVNMMSANRLPTVHRRYGIEPLPDEIMDVLTNRTYGIEIDIDPIAFRDITDGTDAQGNPNPDIIKVEAKFNNLIDYSEYAEKVFRPFHWWGGIPGNDQYNPMHGRVQVITEAPNLYTLVINPLPEVTKVTVNMMTANRLPNVHRRYGIEPLPDEIIDLLIKKPYSIEIDISENENRSVLERNQVYTTNKILLYPNPIPAGSDITLEGVDLKNATIELFDTSGRAISDKIVSKSNEKTVSASQMKKGVYYIRISRQDGSVETKKIVVK